MKYRIKKRIVSYCTCGHNKQDHTKTKCKIKTFHDAPLDAIASTPCSCTGFSKDREFWIATSVPSK